MFDQFIHPNWHVILIHYPLGFLTLGILIELLSFLWPRSGFRAAGRWMILLGALLSIPTALAGAYAFRDVVRPEVRDPQLIRWSQVVQQSPWSAEQWDFMEDHLGYNIAAAAVFLVVVVVWIAASDLWRRRLFWPLLVALLVGAGLMGVGAWHGGEAVYRYGTAVAAQQPPKGQRPPGQGSLAEEHEHGSRNRTANLGYYIPPLESHMLLAGLAIAAGVGALALTIRSWEKPAIAPAAEPGNRVDPLLEDPARDRERFETQSLGPSGEQEVIIKEAPRVFPARFWLLLFLFAIIAAFLGTWSVQGGFSADAFRDNFRDLFEPSHRRMGVHVAAGVGILVLAIVLAALVRFARARRVLAGVIAAILLLIVALQVWLGILMLFDSHSGPLTGFNAT